MATVLLVVGDKASLTTANGDLPIHDRLVGLGHTVVLASDEEAEYAGAYDFLVMTDSCADATIGAKYALVAKPAVLLENGAWLEFGMSQSVANTASVTDWSVTLHDPLSAGLSGVVTIYTAAVAQGATSAGQGSGVQNVASQTANTNKPYFAYEAGATLYQAPSGGASTAAPARRVGFRIAAADVSKMTTAAWSMFDAAVNWSTPVATIPAGAATGTWNVAGSASGAAPANGSGSVTGSWTVVGAADGYALEASPYSDPVTVETIPTGSATGGWNIAGSATGPTATGTGSATGTWSFTGAASGSSTRAGSATGSWSVTGAASGSSTRAGSATGGWAVTGSASGSSLRSGNATGTWNVAGSASGGSSRTGTATGQFVWSGSAAGAVPAVGPNGSVTGSWTVTGTTAGSSTKAGSATGGWTFVGSASGSSTRAGSVSGAWTLVGSANGTAPVVPSGSATGAWTFVGSANGPSVPAYQPWMDWRPITVPVAVPHAQTTAVPLAVASSVSVGIEHATSLTVSATHTTTTAVPLAVSTSATVPDLHATTATIPGPHATTADVDL